MIVVRLCAAVIFAAGLGCLAFVLWRAIRPWKQPDDWSSKYGTVDLESVRNMRP